MLLSGTYFVESLGNNGTFDEFGTRLFLLELLVRGGMGGHLL